MKVATRSKVPGGTSQVALVVKNLFANAGDLGWFLGQEDPLEKEMK